MGVETFQYLLGLIGVIYSVLTPVFEKLSKLKKDQPLLYGDFLQGTRTGL